jgi:excisionase family DNA binding protein
LTLREVAEKLGVSPSTPAVWIYRGIDLPYVRIGRTIRVPHRDFKRWVFDRTENKKFKNFEK